MVVATGSDPRIAVAEQPFPRWSTMTRPASGRDDLVASISVARIAQLEWLNP